VTVGRSVAIGTGVLALADWSWPRAGDHATNVTVNNAAQTRMSIEGVDRPQFFSAGTVSQGGAAPHERTETSRQIPDGTYSGTFLSVLTCRCSPIPHVQLARHKNIADAIF
jgi:hypothetical protein